MSRRTGIRSTVRWGLVLLLAGLAAWLSIRQVRWDTFRSALADPNLPLLALALATVLGTTLAKAARWHVLLGLCQAQASWGRFLRVLLVGQMGSNFLSRLGDVGHAVLVLVRALALDLGITWAAASQLVGGSSSKVWRTP